MIEGVNGVGVGVYSTEPLNRRAMASGMLVTGTLGLFEAEVASIAKTWSPKWLGMLRWYERGMV
jgi:hypothetical protein